MTGDYERPMVRASMLTSKQQYPRESSPRQTDQTERPIEVEQITLRTVRRRPLPQFIIIGAQKAGTTTLYDALTQHPNVVRAKAKELHYFDNLFRLGLNWYRSCFPEAGEDSITGEASPYYLFHPLAPARCNRSLPGVKIVVLLRNPVDRAYSHYQHQVRHGHEPLSFEEAIEKENERLYGETQKLIDDESYHSYAHQHFSYVSRGNYLDQLRAWRRHVDAAQMMLLCSERLRQDPATEYSAVLRFLNLPEWQPSEFPASNSAGYPAMSGAARGRLGSVFDGQIRELQQYVNAEWPGRSLDFAHWVD